MKLKIKIELIFLLLCSVIILLSACNSNNKTLTNDANTKTEYLQYTNAANKVKINYPTNWTVKDGYLGSIALILSPPENEADVFQENISIVQDIAPQTIDLKKYSDMTVAQLKEFMTDFKLISSGKSELLNQESFKIVYTGKQGEEVMKFMQSWTIKDKKAFIITYSAQIDKFDIYIDTISEMEKSFTQG